MATDNSKNLMGLKTQATELVKQYFTYDGEGRMISVITAYTDAQNGSPATEVIYEYVGPGSGSVLKMKERAVDGAGAQIVWLTAYDVVGA